MRNIHPTYPAATITCACGAVITTRTTRGDFTVDVCSACHPFYTGKQKLMDTAGRVDRFRKKFGDTKAARAAAPPQQVAKPKAEKAEKPKKAKKVEEAADAAEAPKAEEPQA